MVIPATVLAFVAVAFDTVRSLRTPAGTGAGPDALYEERLLAATRRTLDAMDRHWIDAEAGVQLGALARVPLSLRATGPEIGSHSAITSADDLIAAVVELRGALSLALVGEPGSGKTTFLRDIAWALTEDAPARRRRWLATGSVYLLIDNLSWLPGPARRKVIEELNAFKDRHPSVGLLISANEDGTRALGAELRLPTLLIERVTAHQVLMHLARARGTHDELATVAASSSELVEVMRTRMFLTAALLAFPDTDGTTMLRLRTATRGRRSCGRTRIPCWRVPKGGRSSSRG